MGCCGHSIHSGEERAGGTVNLLTPKKKRSSLFWIITGFIGAACVGLLDFLTGWELSFSLFYLLPIVLVTWYAGRNPGLVFSVLCGLVWFVVDSLSGHVYSYPAFRAWNAIIRLSFFVVVTLLLPSLKALGREKELARQDHLTGAANRRHFFEAVQMELDRSQRYKHAFTIAYIDIDDFKAVNDRFGHNVGDDLLRAVVQRVRRLLRKSDLLARLGGDEFIVLLPVTGRAVAELTVTKIQTALTDEMRSHNWPVTFSIGALTCTDAHLTSDELIKKADELMYSVKMKGKNGIAYGIHAGGIGARGRERREAARRRS
jgi:diguanylate cyclase (GGDEF)-like protein